MYFAAEDIGKLFLKALMKVSVYLNLLYAFIPWYVATFKTDSHTP